jgi:hypothetical protein
VRPWRDAAVVGRQQQAACRGAQLDFVDGDALVALRFCAACQVRLECLRCALDFEAVGVWGGHYFPGDRQLRRRVAMAARRELRVVAA